jgi:hypothetical protein
VHDKARIAAIRRDQPSARSLEISARLSADSFAVLVDRHGSKPSWSGCPVGVAQKRAGQTTVAENTREAENLKEVAFTVSISPIQFLNGLVGDGRRLGVLMLGGYAAVTVSASVMVEDHADPHLQVPSACHLPYGPCNW